MKTTRLLRTERVCHVEPYSPSQLDDTDEGLFRCFEILLCSEGDYKVTAGY